jgi:pantoate--beta-alanine ligase
MKVVSSVSEWKALRPKLSLSLGLVPTMGFLHEGHLSLVRRARAENEVAVVWIFVNPKQFGAGEDFATYPRDMDRDLRMLEAERVDYVLAPSVEGVYPPGYQTHVSVDELAKPLEGAARPGHFRGVATVVAKMFCLTQPRRAYFGQKDAQQCAVVKRMSSDLGMLLDIVVCPTVREPDGLAMSSRNAYLQPEERQASTVVYRALKGADQAFRAGERRSQNLRQLMRATIEAEPLAALDYAAVADPETFAEPEQAGPGALVLLAVKIGRTRLIDNLVLGE